MSSPHFAYGVCIRRARCSVRRILFAAFSISLALAGNVVAAEPPLSLPQARQIAVERSRQLTAQDFAAASSRHMAVAARQLPDPVLKLGVTNLPVTGTDRFQLGSDFMTMRSVGVMQEITRGEKRQARASRFESEAQTSMAEKTAVAAQIERDTALAWLDRYYAESMAAVLAEQGQQARLEIEAAEGAYRAGRGSQADVFMARSALSAYDDRASEISRRVRNAVTMLARWVGEAADRPLGAKPRTDTIRLDPATLETQLSHHPEIDVLAKREEVAQAEARMAQANRKSDWSVELMYSQRGSAYSDMVSVGVSIPLQWDQKNRQDRELSAKLATVEQAKAQREESLRQHVAETRTMIHEWENNRERLERYARELVPLAKERTEASLAAYRGGRSGLEQVLAARRNEIDVRLQAQQLEWETARIWAQINFLFPETAPATHVSFTGNKDQK